MKKIVLILIFFVSGLALVSAQSKDIVAKNSLVKYDQKLNLTETQKKDFITIIKKYNLLIEEFESQNAVNKTNNNFNYILKNEISEVYKVLTRQQFVLYKKVKKDVEPNKIFKTN